MADRAERVGRRRPRARAAGEAAGAPRRHDRHVRRPLPAPRAAAADGDRRAAGLRPPPRGREGAAERPLDLGPLGRVRRRAPRGGARARGRADRARRARGRPRRALRRLPGGARGARPRRPRARARRGRPPADDGLRGLARRARLRLRVRGPDRRRVEPAGGAGRPRRGDGLAPVRARPGRVRRAADDGRRPRRPRRPDRGAPAAVRRDRASGDRPRGAAAVRGRPRGRAAARGRRPLLRGGRRPRRARARRRGRPRARARRHGAGADRDRLPGARALARAARDGPLDARDPVRAGGAAPPAADALRRGARWRCSATRGSTASATPSSRTCARRTRASSARTSTSSRAGSAAARSRRPSASRPSWRPCAARACRRSRRSGPAASRWRPCARSRRRCSAPPSGPRRRRSARARAATCAPSRRCASLLDELDAWAGLAGGISREDVVAALERATVRGASAGEPGRVSVTDLSRVRTRRLEAVYVLGLEEGSLPRRRDGSPFLDDDARRALGGRLLRADQASRDRYLFYTACARASRRLTLVREAATDEGSPREPSPFWEEVAALFPAEDVARWTRRRALSALTWPLEAAPSERERLRALALLAADPGNGDEARGLARANGWERRLDRALESVRPPHAPPAPARPAPARRPGALQRDRARALRRLLLGLVLRPRRRPAPHRRRDRREAPRLGRAHDAAPVLRRAAEGGRRATASSRNASTRRSRSCAGASSRRSRASGSR